MEGWFLGRTKTPLVDSSNILTNTTLPLCKMPSGACWRLASYHGGFASCQQGWWFPRWSPLVHSPGVHKCLPTAKKTSNNPDVQIMGTQQGLPQRMLQHCTNGNAWLPHSMQSKLHFTTWNSRSQCRILKRMWRYTSTYNPPLYLTMSLEPPWLVFCSVMPIGKTSSKRLSVLTSGIYRAGLCAHTPPPRWAKLMVAGGCLWWYFQMITPKLRHTCVKKSFVKIESNLRIIVSRVLTKEAHKSGPISGQIYLWFSLHWLQTHVVAGYVQT